MGSHSGYDRTPRSPRQPRRLAPLAPLSTSYAEEERLRSKRRRNRKKKRQLKREEGVGMESPRLEKMKEPPTPQGIQEDEYTMTQKIVIGNDEY